MLAFFVPTSDGCIEEMPRLLKVRARYGGPDVVVVGVTNAHGPEVREFIRAHELTFPVLTEAAFQFELY